MGLEVDSTVHICILGEMDKTQQKDQKGYAYIRSRIIHDGVTPSLREIAGIVGYNSPRSVQLMIERLEKRGFLSYKKGVIRLPGAKGSQHSGERTVDVPLVGSVACGLPSLAEQDPEAVIEVSTRIARPGHNYFLLRARGTSMNRAGISDGDIVLVRQQHSAEENDKVVALINDEATIKRFGRRGNVVVLKPDSTDSNHKPMVVSHDLLIQGVVAAVLPKAAI